MLCGKRQAVGLSIGGCLLCFDCEKALLRPGSARMKRRKRLRLMRLYTAQG